VSHVNARYHTPPNSGLNNVQATWSYLVSHDVKDLRRALGLYATGVTVITTRVAGTAVGLTANSFTSISLAPPLLLFCIGRSRNSFDAFRKAPSFAVNVLSSSQRDLSEAFASSGPEKWSGVEFQDDGLGNPVFPEAVAAFTCHRREIIDAADHMIVIGEIADYRQRHGVLPLVYCRSRYCLPIDVSSVAHA
jgi:flavin reductase (DIM6/NTAB) family NADH-FMN oxidoreductase RutF